MNQLGEIKKLQCAKCRKDDSETTITFYCDGCEDYVCNSCVYGPGNFSGICPRCNHYLSCFEIPFYKESSMAKSPEVEKKLKDEISLFKKQQTVNEATQEDLQKKILKLEKELEMTQEDLRKNIFKLEKEREMTPEDHQKCSECETKDSEQNMQLCATCHGLKFKNIEDVKECAICPACSIKKHMRKGHHTVDLYPYLSAYNFSSHSSKIESQSEEVKNARDTLNDTVSRFNALSTDASENYDVLTDMARRSKTTKNQLEFIEKMEAFSNETKSIHTGADSDLKKHTEFLQDSVTKIKEWCNARMDNCVDESETIKVEKSETHDENDSDIGSIECIQDDAEC